ncbi:LPS export ABC transporter permease LptF [Micavibrio aeruginosavorus]|uniref:LPS export ABC transporter permease LptF n=1 Tax=Micavibrio aeruginosavorus TaxID=349221 RepID=UPI003F4ABC3E
MAVFDRYLLKTLLIATVFIAVVLAAIIFLTQSLRFLELVINAGASGSAFWLLTLLALPRFFEIILPIALLAAIVFIYNRMTMDSELVVMRAIGASPARLARPALMLALGVSVVLLIMTAWLAPVTLAGMQHLRQVIKAQYSSLLFREGVFNAVAPGLTVYMRERLDNGELGGLMIHDTRAENPTPVTVIAKRGVMVATDSGQQVVVYDGSRQAMDESTGNLTRLDFDRYLIDLPEGSGVVRQRWREPEERTLFELFRPDMANEHDRASRHDFMVEAHRRIISPFLALTYSVIGLAFLLLGPVDRRGQSRRIVAAIAAVVGIQGLYLAAFNMAQDHIGGLILMDVLVLGPLLLCGYLLSGASEAMRQKPWCRTLSSLFISGAKNTKTGGAA